MIILISHNKTRGERMKKKKYKFELSKGAGSMGNVVETLELDANLSEDEVDEIFKEWVFIELDREGIEGTWDEVAE